MSDAYAIEVADEIIGIAVRQNGEQGFRFHAALNRYFPIDGQIFARPAEIQKAAAALKPTPPKPRRPHAAPAHELTLAG